MSSQGFVNQVFCDMVNWQWYRDIIVSALFEHLLRIANKHDKMELGLCIKSGSVLTSSVHLASFFNLSERQVKHALFKLKSSHDISVINLHKQGIIITINEWDKYQCDNIHHERCTNMQYRENDINLSDKCPIQDDVNKDVTNKNKSSVSDKCPIKNQNTDEGNKKSSSVSDKCPTQTNELEHNTNLSSMSMSDKCPMQGMPNEAENEESTSIPPKEDKDSKEKNINININKKENSLKITFNFDTNAFENITDADMALWRKTYPAIDIQQEINKAACWLVANPTRVKSNYKRFLNSWLCKAQDHFHPSQQLLQFPPQSTYGRPTESKPFDPSKFQD